MGGGVGVGATPGPPGIMGGCGVTGDGPGMGGGNGRGGLPGPPGIVLGRGTVRKLGGVGVPIGAGVSGRERPCVPPNMLTSSGIAGDGPGTGPGNGRGGRPLPLPGMKTSLMRTVVRRVTVMETGVEAGGGGGGDGGDGVRIGCGGVPVRVDGSAWWKKPGGIMLVPFM